MALQYQTGVFTSAKNLLDLLETFASTHGWTVNTSTGTGGDPSNEQLSLQSDGHVVNIIAENTNGRWRAQPSTAWINNSTNFYAHTGTPNSGGAVTTTVQFTLLNGSGVAYHFFASDSAPRYIHVVAETTANRFSHFSFGTITKLGTWTGGGYVTGLAASTTVVTQTMYPFGYDINITNGTQWLRVDNLVGLGSPGWRQEWGQFETNDGGEPMTNYLWKCGLDTQTQRSMLAPIFCVAEAAEGQPVSAGLLLGSIPNARFISMEGRQPGETLTIGSDTWRVFPIREKVSATGTAAYTAAGTAPNFHTALSGLAYRQA